MNVSTSDFNAAKSNARLQTTVKWLIFCSLLGATTNIPGTLWGTGVELKVAWISNAVVVACLIQYGVILQLARSQRWRAARTLLFAGWSMTGPALLSIVLTQPPTGLREIFTTVAAVYVAVVLLGVVTLAPWEEARRWWVISLLFYTIGSIVLAVVSTGGARHGLTMLVVVLSLYGAAMLCARILVRDHQEALHEAHAANAAKSRFLANMSHELRTPLNAVLGYVELVQEAPEQTIRSAEADLDRVHVSATHLLGLINSVLDLAKVEAGRLEVRMGPTDVHRLLVQTVETLLPQAEAKGLSLTLVSAPMEIRSDTAMLKQVVLNLLSNAVKFTDAGQVTVQARRTEGGVVIQIRDTGVGIAADRLEDIFQAFERTQAEVTTRVGGTGLGLAISRRLADVLGGTLDVESVVGEGTCFTLEIPA